MALISRALIVVALTATIFSTMALAKDFVVGDESGWTTGFDYHSWAANKIFRVGDTLTFKYVAGKDSVVRVNGSDFVSCSVPQTATVVLTSGDDTIVLTSTGRRGYISGVHNHCKSGQKLLITVLPPQEEASWSPSHSHSPSPSAVPAPSPSAPWTATVPHFRRSITKKLTKVFRY